MRAFVCLAFLTTLCTLGSAPALTVTYTSKTVPYPGVTVRTGHSSSPKRNFYVAFVDLCADHVHVRATATPTKRQTCGAWAGNVGVQLAVNGDFFKYETPPKIYGDAVGDGVRWPFSLSGVDDTSGWYKQNYGWIAVGPGWVDFTHTEHIKKNAKAFEAAGYTVSSGWAPKTVAPDPPPGTVALVSGFSELVIEGKVYTCPDAAKPATCFPDRGDMSQWHKRTAMGITADRKTLILLVMTSSTNGEELAKIMAKLGAWQAFNLDGGGSSTLWLKSKGYLYPTGTKRAVANHWGIYAGAASGTTAMPGSCFVPGGCYPVALGGATGVFADYPPGWLHYGHAKTLYELGVAESCSLDGSPMYCPKCSTTRRDMGILVARAAGMDLTSPPKKPSFDDVPKSDPAYAEIEAMLAAGVTNGCGATKFCPDAAVTRGQAAKFLQKAAGWPGVKPATPTFSDVPKGYLFYASIEAIAEKCVTNGCGDGNFCPENEITRGQAAAFVARTFDVKNANKCIDYCDPATCAGGKTCGKWSPCGGFESGVCDETGTKTRECTSYTTCDPLSLDPTCGETTDDEVKACKTDKTGQVVEGWSAWSECAFADPCDTEGTSTRSRTVCQGGTAVAETQEQACSRDDPCPEPPPVAEPSPPDAGLDEEDLATAEPSPEPIPEPPPSPPDTDAEDVDRPTPTADSDPTAMPEPPQGAAEPDEVEPEPPIGGSEAGGCATGGSGPPTLPLGLLLFALTLAASGRRRGAAG